MSQCACCTLWVHSVNLGDEALEMDLLAILKIFRRHKYLVLAVSVATLLGIAYVFAGTPTVFKQSSSLVLLQPRSAPSAADRAEDPSLENADSYNPFAGDPSLIVGVVSARLTNDATRDSFGERGLDPNYDVAAAVSYGMSRPQLEVVAFGASPEETVSTRTALASEVLEEIEAVQAEQGVNDYFMVTAIAVEPTSNPVQQTSSLLRSAIAIAIAGGILLFALLSLALAWDQRRVQDEAGPDEAGRGKPPEEARPADPPDADRRSVGSFEPAQVPVASKDPPLLSKEESTPGTGSSETHAPAL
jgi:hypothetical protein